MRRTRHLFLPRGSRLRRWASEPTVEIVAGDVGDTSTLAEKMQGCSAAYYLVHSMLTAGPAYASKDSELASSFSTAAARAGCERILYLGGLGETGEGLSNLDYAYIAAELGKYALASETLNCSAPDTGNMEVLERVGTPEQKKQWLEPLRNGEIRSAYALS